MSYAKSVEEVNGSGWISPTIIVESEERDLVARADTRVNEKLNEAAVVFAPRLRFRLKTAVRAAEDLIDIT